MNAASSWNCSTALRRRLAVGFALLAGSMFAAEPPAAPTAAGEYQVKAVFLFNFAQFVEWPSRTFVDARAPLVIGVLGEDPFGTYLDDLVKGDKIVERPIVIRRFQRIEDVGDYHILYISNAESGALDKIIPALKDRSVLTVSDAVNFSRQGGMVRFVTESGKIRMRINVEAARAAALTISSKILRPATIVTREKD